MKEIMTNNLSNLEAKDEFQVALKLFNDDPDHI
jgi:hypothetical protein